MLCSGLDEGGKDSCQVRYHLLQVFTLAYWLCKAVHTCNLEVGLALGMHRYHFFQYSPDTDTFIFVLADTEYRY